MPAIKTACPSCRSKLKLLKANGFVRCPQCNHRFFVSGNGALAGGAAVPMSLPVAPPPGSPDSMGQDAEVSSGSLGTIAAIGGGGAVVLGLGIWLLVVCLGNTPTGEGDAREQVVNIPSSPPNQASTNPPKLLPKELDGESLTPPPPAKIILASAKGEAGPLTSALFQGEPLDGIVKPPQVNAGHPDVDQAKVDRAIAQGLAFLKQNALRENMIGPKAFAGLTLLHCGVPADDDVVKTLARDVRDSFFRLYLTYDMTACIWFLDKLNQEEDRSRLRTLALRLLASQGNSGGWAYGSHFLTKDQEVKLTQLLKDDKKASAKSAPSVGVAIPGFLAPASALTNDLLNLPVVKYRPGSPLSGVKDVGRVDNSITQFVVLALWTCQKYDVPVQRSLAMVEKRFRAAQDSSGSWEYMAEYSGPNGILRDTGTNAGLLALAVGVGNQLNGAGIDASAESGKVSDPAIERGFTYLANRLERLQPVPKQARAQNQDRSKVMYELYQRMLKSTLAGKVDADYGAQLNRIMSPTEPGNVGKSSTQIITDTHKGAIVGAEAWGDLYFLWSLERLGMVYNLKTIGKTDWYGWGAPLILGAEEPDGSWRDAFPGVPDTCFALLFLKRANVVQDLSRRLQDLAISKDVGERGRAEVDPQRQATATFGRRPSLEADQRTAAGYARGMKDDRP